MRQGMKIALITDAGMPGISDPGEELTAMALEAGIPVTAVPGPAACVTGLVLSGLPSRRFAFEAFLPQDKKERREILRELKEEFRTMVLYEAPHRLLRTLEELREVLGESRRAAVCRELTKKHETLFRGTLGEACAHYRQEAPRGECVLVLEGRSRLEVRQAEQENWKAMSLEDHMALYMEKGMDRKEAMKQVARDRGCSKRDVYQQLLEQEE